MNYETVGSTVKKMAKSRNCSAELDDDWADEIAEYHKQQSGKWKSKKGTLNEKVIASQ